MTDEPLGEVVEHAIEMSGGGMHIRNGDPEIDRIFPLADWIKSYQRFGGKVWRRTVIVVEDWHEVERASDTKDNSSPSSPSMPSFDPQALNPGGPVLPGRIAILYPDDFPLIKPDHRETT